MLQSGSTSSSIPPSQPLRLTELNPIDSQRLNQRKTPGRNPPKCLAAPQLPIRSISSAPIRASNSQKALCEGTLPMGFNMFFPDADPTGRGRLITKARPCAR